MYPGAHALNCLAHSLALSLFLCWGTAQLDPLRLVGSRAADPLGAIVMVQARGLSWPKGTVRAREETGLGVMFWRLMNLWRCLRGRSQRGSRGSRETQEESSLVSSSVSQIQAPSNQTISLVPQTWL